MQKPTAVKLNILYACVAGLFWAMYCPVVSFTSVYLLNRGIGNTQIGILMASAQIAAAFAQPLLGSRVDKSRTLTNGKMSIILTAIAGICSLILCFLLQASPVFILLEIAVITASTALQPFNNALAFDHEKEGYTINFGLGRGMGSVTYAISALLLGYLVEIYSPNLLPYVAAAQAVLLTVATLLYMKPAAGKMPAAGAETGMAAGAKTGAAENAEPVNSAAEQNVPVSDISTADQLQTSAKGDSKADSLKDFILGHKKFMILQIGVMFIFFSHLTLNTYFLQIEKSVGGSSKDMGLAIFYASIIEVPIMFFFIKIIKRISCEKIMAFACIMFVVKHFLTYAASSVGMILFAQSFEIVSYAIFIPASVYYTKMLIEERNRTKGQTFAVIAMTCGNILSSFAGGFLLDSLGAKQMLLIAAISAAIGAAIAVTHIEKLPAVRN